MARFLIVCFDTALAAGLGAALARAGVEAAFADPRADLAAQIGASRHENAAMLLAGWPDDAPAWIGNGFPPCPVSVVGAASAGCDSTCAGWWPPGIAAAPDELAAALALDSARWRREAGLRAELAAARAQLDERKWVERAKGLLMHARGASENDAFRLLREASMHANLRLAQVSRSVIEATAWAEAVNRAGQLRMLSQRLVKLAAQALAGIDLRRAETLQRKAARRAQANLDHLAAAPLVQADAALAAAVARASAGWQGLKQELAQPPGPARMAALDRAAEALLVAAEALTGALEASGAPRALHIVNLCGRQRMRVQRLAKSGLLAALGLDGSDAAALPAQIEAFDTALRELEDTPLSSAAIRAALAEARELWLAQRHALAAADAASLARGSDALLEVFERLTVCYERSLQVILS